VEGGSMEGRVNGGKGRGSRVEGRGMGSEALINPRRLEHLAQET
jgi:hypothetical protein